jgi:N-acetylmuramic acid 6-phosphate etherase
MTDATPPLPATERSNPDASRIDAMSTLDMLTLINREDQRVALAVQRELPNIALAVDAVYARLSTGGRLFYTGAGTSGRLGVLDASEMPPTFSVPHGVVIGIIAGGERAVRYPIEGAEDDVAAGANDLQAHGFAATDALVGIAASGRTPYVIGALRYARGLGAVTISLACSMPAAVHDAAEINIAPLPGPEVISGSTRMKSGTAQKLVLNMLSTGVMVRLGKTYGNLMVDLMSTNKKLEDRARRIVAEAAGATPGQAAELLAQAGGEVKTAILMHRLNIGAAEARERLARAGGVMRAALGE